MITTGWRERFRAILTERNTRRTAVVAVVFGLSAITSAHRIPELLAAVEGFLQCGSGLALFAVLAFSAFMAQLVKYVWPKDRPYQSAGGDAATAYAVAALLCWYPHFCALIQGVVDRPENGRGRVHWLFQTLTNMFAALPIPLGWASVMVGVLATAVAAVLSARRRMRSRSLAEAHAATEALHSLHGELAPGELCLCGSISPGTARFMSRHAAKEAAESEASKQDRSADEEKGE